jgi:EpsD family peptidyl-prolyl cis-trans isomerase
MSLSIQALCRRGGVLVAVCCAALLATACSKGEKADKKATVSQVAVKVNDEEISEHQVNLLLERHAAGVSAANAPAAARRVLDGLVDQELVAQAARKEGMEQDPRVVQRMEAARRDVLALAYLERLGEKVTEPTTDEIDRYYEAHPELFAQRRLFSLQETTVAVAADRFGALKAKLEGTESLERMNEALRAESLKSGSRQMSISAEDVPFTWLERLVPLKAGQSIVMTRDGGARVLTVLSVQLAPIPRADAQKLIALFLTKDRKRQAQQAGLKALRDAAKIEFAPRFAPPASGAAAAAPTAPAFEAASEAGASAAQ